MASTTFTDVCYNHVYCNGVCCYNNYNNYGYDTNEKPRAPIFTGAGGCWSGYAQFESQANSTA